MMFLLLRKLGNICCGHKMFLNKIRNIFCVPNLCPQQMLPARANGETFVSATMCPQQCVLDCQCLNFKFKFSSFLPLMKRKQQPQNVWYFTSFTYFSPKKEYLLSFFYLTNFAQHSFHLVLLYVNLRAQ